MTQPAAPAPLLSVRGLRTYFDTEAGVAKAVDGVDLDIRPGEVLGLVGDIPGQPHDIGELGAGGRQGFADIDQDLAQLSGDGLRKAARLIWRALQEASAHGPGARIYS